MCVEESANPLNGQGAGLRMDCRAARGKVWKFWRAVWCSGQLNPYFLVLRGRLVRPGEVHGH